MRTTCASLSSFRTNRVRGTLLQPRRHEEHEDYEATRFTTVDTKDTEGCKRVDVSDRLAGGAGQRTDEEFGITNAARRGLFVIPSSSPGRRFAGRSLRLRDWINPS